MSVILYQKLALNTFLFEFDNLERAYGRKSCYICFALEPILTGGAGAKLWGYVASKSIGVTPQKSPEKSGGAHAEELLLSEMERHVSKHSGVRFSIDWFMSWSPCERCSGTLHRWLRLGGARHRLCVSFARVYRRERGTVRAGLRRLRRDGVKLYAMDAGLYECCAYALVDARHGDPAPSWLSPWCRNVLRVQQVIDEIMDEEDDDWSNMTDLGELLEFAMGSQEGWDEDGRQLSPGDPLEVADRAPVKQGSPGTTDLLALPKKRQREASADASTAKRALFLNSSP